MESLSFLGYMHSYAHAWTHLHAFHFPLKLEELPFPLSNEYHLVSFIVDFASVHIYVSATKPPPPKKNHLILCQLIFFSFLFFFKLEMGTHILENILRTRCMDLVSILLQMGIGMREPGMRVEGKGLECTHSEMVKHNLVTGKMEFLTYQAPRTQPILYLLLLFIILKYSMQCRYFLLPTLIM